MLSSALSVVVRSMSTRTAVCPKCVVVGGGISGLAVSAALETIAGIQDVRIFEMCSQQDFDDVHQGAALQLGPNGLKCIRKLGGEASFQKVLSEGSRIEGNVVLMGNTRKGSVMVPDTTFTSTGLPQVLIRWGVLRNILRELLQDTQITTSANCENGKIRNKDEGDILVDLHNHTDDTLVIAADGIHSQFARTLHPNKNIKDNGRVNIKAVCENTLEGGITYSFFKNDIACFAGPAGNNYTYWAISIASDSQESDYSNKSEVKLELLKTLSGIEAPEFIMKLIEHTCATRIFVRRSEESIHVGPTLVGDNLALVGDSAHAISPSYGQCASMALEDAVTLATCIKNGETLQKALKQYSSARMSRSEEMVRRSAQRTRQAIQGEKTEDVSQWIFQWEPPE